MLGAAAACAAAGPEAAAEAEATDMAALFPADKKLQPAWVESLTARGTRKVCAGKELATIAMPCGGIAAGQLCVRGDHCARAMASWGCLLGAEGYVYDGPAGRIGFAPRLTPHDFKAFFTAAQGWGSLVQSRKDRTQTDRVELKFGKLSARTLVFDLPEGGRATKAAVTVAGRAVPAEMKQEASRITLALAEPATINRGEALQVAITLA